MKARTEEHPEYFKYVSLLSYCKDYIFCFLEGRSIKKPRSKWRRVDNGLKILFHVWLERIASLSGVTLQYSVFLTLKTEISLGLTKLSQKRCLRFCILQFAFFKILSSVCLDKERARGCWIQMDWTADTSFKEERRFKRRWQWNRKYV